MRASWVEFETSENRPSMTEPVWSINLGRWWGVRIRVHLLWLAFAVHLIATLTLAGWRRPGLEIDIDPRDWRLGLAWLGLTVLGVAWHELGHGLAGRWSGWRRQEVQLWPLGDLTDDWVPAEQARAAAIYALGGPLANLAVVILGALIFAGRPESLDWNPFGRPDGSGGLPRLDDQPLARFSWLWWLGGFWFVNWVLLLTNLIPAPPLDGGRFLRAVLAMSSSPSRRESFLIPWTARTCAAVLLLVGVVRLIRGVFIAPGEVPTASPLYLIVLAGLIEWIARTQNEMVEDDGFFDDGVSDLDPSTLPSTKAGQPDSHDPLEPNSSHVAAGSAGLKPTDRMLRRWHKRRRQARQLRNRQREHLDGDRLDAILDKLHGQGETALNDEERGFLQQMSRDLRRRRGRLSSTANPTTTLSPPPDLESDDPTTSYD